MSIIEILEAHDGVLTPMMHEDYALRCVCGTVLQGWQAESHRAHVALVLEQHEREAKAEAWDACEAYWEEAHKMSHHEPWEYMIENPYKESE